MPEDGSEVDAQELASDIRSASDEAELESILSGLARSAKAEEENLRGGVEFKPRGDLPEVPGVQGTGRGGAPAALQDDSLDDLQETLGGALQSTAEYFAVQFEVQPPEPDGAESVARSWLRVYRLYADVDPRAAAVAAAVASTVSWAGPSALEVWLKYQHGELPDQEEDERQGRRESQEDEDGA